VSADALADKARGGSVPAFEALVRREQALVRGFLRRLCGDAALADDLAQETFVFAWRRIGDFQGRGAFRGWLCQIAYRRFLQRRRSDKAALAREEEVMRGVSLSVDGRAADAQIDLARVLTQVSAEQRAVLTLCLGEGFSHSEAAEALGLPVGTVKSHLARGREKVLSMLAEPLR
jgi:RNA polymerase sigma-70 factor (ECF subfamily)